MNKSENGQMLGPYRVLDLTDEKGLLCGRTLADLGADVIQIEPPGGSHSRDIGPFYRDFPHREKSLFWFAFCSNKRGITLDIDTKEGQQIFEKLVESADFVFESFSPGYMDSIGIGYDSLRKINPKLIMTSITPFGQQGPNSQYKDSDLVAMANSGYLYVTGDDDRPPVRMSIPQAYSHAGTEAAVASLIALFNRNRTENGQHVDVSIQASVARNLLNSTIWWNVNKVVLKRAGLFRTGLSTTANQRIYWECKDGYVVFALFGGVHGAPTNQAFTDWMDSEGMAPRLMKEMDWLEFDMATATQEDFDLLEEPIAKFFKTHTRKELWDGGFARGMMLYPLNTVEDTMADPQLKARDFWQEVKHSELNDIFIYPGDWVKLSSTSCRKRFRAPLIGEHNQDVYIKELGYSKGDLVLLKQEGVI